MILDKHWGIIGIALWLSCLVLIQTGCMAASALKGKKGVSVDFIKTGISKAEVEEVLGSPVRKWMTPSNIYYSVYKYDAGVPPSIGDATANALMDVATLGLLELFPGLNYLSEKRVLKKMAVAYDSQNVVVGVFDHFNDFDELPLDGKSNK